MRHGTRQFYGIGIAFTLMLIQGVVFGQAVADLQAQAAADERARHLKEVEDQTTLNVINDLLARANEASTLLADLQSKADTFFPRLDALLVNDDGKRLASNDAAFLHFMDLQNEPVYRSAVIRSRAGAIDGIIVTLKRVRAAPPVGFVPPESTKNDIEDSYVWAKSGLAHLTAENGWIDAAIAKAPKDLDLAKQNTLKDMIVNFKLKEIQDVSEVRLKAMVDATPEADKIIANAARNAALEKANEEAATLLQQQDEEIARLKIEQDMAFKRLKDTQDQQVADLNQKLAESEAARAKQNAVTNAIVDTGKVEAEKIRLKQKCQDPHVTGLLAPFLTPGNWQPTGSFSIDKVPMSFSRLREGKALERDERGLLAMVEIAENRSDKQRPRWSMPPNPRRMSPSQLEQAKEAQDDLNELGPTMVELGMLSP